MQSKIKMARDQRPPRYGTEPVKLVAVGKRQPVVKIDAAYERVSEFLVKNRVQEAIQRWRNRREAHKDLTLHLIGPLQTNKVAEAVSLFDVIEIVDREKLARAWSKK